MRNYHKEGGEVEETMYIAVSMDMKQNKYLLTWALENSRGKQLCAIHVHPLYKKSITLDPDPDPDPLYYHPLADMLSSSSAQRRKSEEVLLSAVLDDFLHNSQRSAVDIEKLYVKASTIEEGIIELIEQHRIANLVMGTTAGKFYSRKTIKSKKAVYVRDNAPPFCHIWFICKGRLVHTREAINPLTSSPGKNVPSDQLSCWSTDASDDLSSSLPTTQSSSNFMMGNKSETSLLDCDLTEADNSRSVEFGESLRCQIAENKAEKAERLYAEELRLRKSKEEELAKERGELKTMQDLWKQISNELSMTAAQKRALVDQLEDAKLSLKKSEDRLLSAMESIEKYKIEHDEMHVKMNNALEEAQNLRKQLSERSSSSSNISPFLSVFSMSDLEEATNCFDPHLKIGEGGYGNIYKGFLRHTEVAIKKLHHNSTQGPREFLQEVEVLSKLRHPNLVTLVGACPESWALVYEYLPGGNLEDRLTCKDNAHPLPWQTRIRIATELCSALIFLHSSQLGCIIHGDLKPSNVLLDENCVCKLSDFGISRVASINKASTDQTTLVFTNELKGSIMYIDPEYLATGELTRKSDVYSFGVILLRLLTGKSAFRIAREVVSAISKGALDSILDPSAGDWPFVQAEQLAHMALRCCDMSRKNRPDLGSDVWRILAPMKSSCQGLSILRLVPDNQIPSYFICPIIQEIMVDPHIASDGFSYEAEAIRGWLDSGHDTSPMTNVTLANHILTPNRALRSAIQEWLQLNQSVYIYKNIVIKLQTTELMFAYLREAISECRRSGSEVPVNSLSDTELQKFRECERQEVYKILDDCTRLCASFQVSSNNIYIEKESVTQGILELITQHRIRTLVMGAAVNGQYSRRMVTPMSGKANYVLHHAPDYCHIWFVCMYQLIYMRDRLSQPAVDSEYMDTLLDNINKLDQLLKISFSHPPICSPEVEAAHSPPWSSFTKRHAPKRHANLGLDLFEILYYEEYELRKTLEEKLAKGKEVIENIKRLWNVISPELHKSLDKQSLLESQIADSNAEVKELEEKIISAVDLLQKFKTKRDKYEMERDKALQENEGLKKLVAQEPSCSRFSYSELHKATNHFDRTLIIGEEGNGSTYKGFLCRTEVAIKMLNSSSILEYDQNVAILSKLRHPRVVTLIGVCPESCALVYEYLSGGSLGNRLFFKNDSPPLKWQTRIQIANDICSALIFIHSSQPNGSIIHGNLKPSNILLDDNFSVKLSDFGICHVIPDTETTSERIARLCTIVKNCTMIYIDPDFLLTGELTPKSDVYSFGIILLHLLTGINTLGIAKEVKYALRRDDLYSILDPSAGDWPFVQAQQIAHLALRCSDLDPENRPDLESDVWSVLQQMIVSGCGLSTTLKPSSEQAPDHFKCPISMEIMEDPHIASDGYTYEGKEIKKWLGSGRNTSPMTGLKLDNLVLIPNRSLRSAIQEWLQHPQTVS